jgi:acetoacetyl-CoA synthetase
LNPSGVRFGSGEIYTVLEQFSTVVDDSLCVGQRRAQDKDERVLLFLKMRPGHKFTKSLIEQIRSGIRKSLSARHVPSYIFEIEEIPVSYFLLFVGLQANFSILFVLPSYAAVMVAC